MKSVNYIKELPNTGGWQDRHRSAIFNPTLLVEKPIVDALRSWIDYALSHRQNYKTSIGDDGVLGEYWLQIGLGVRGLLNGDCGRLDCGTLDEIIVDNLNTAGFEEGKDW